MREERSLEGGGGEGRGLGGCSRLVVPIFLISAVEVVAGGASVHHTVSLRLGAPMIDRGVGGKRGWWRRRFGSPSRSIGACVCGVLAAQIWMEVRGPDGEGGGVRRWQQARGVRSCHRTTVM